MQYEIEMSDFSSSFNQQLLLSTLTTLNYVLDVKRLRRISSSALYLYRRSD